VKSEDLNRLGKDIEEEKQKIVKKTKSIVDSEDEDDFIDETLEKKLFMIYPNNPLLGNWDLFMIGVLIFSVMITPIRIAFVKSYEQELL